MPDPMTEQPAGGQSAGEDGHRCEICGREETNASLLESCIGCGATFHLNPRNDVEGIDCGDAVLGPEFGVHFYCQNCIDRAGAEAGGERAPAEAQPQPPLTPKPGGDAPPPRQPRAAPPRRYRRIDRP